MTLYHRASEFGTLYFAENAGDEAQTIRIGSGYSPSVQGATSETPLLPLHVPPHSVRHMVAFAHVGKVLLSTNAQVLEGGEEFLILYGEAGEEVSIGLNDSVHTHAVPGDVPEVFEAHGMYVHLMRRELAERAWILQSGDIIAGAYLVRENGSQVLAEWLEDDLPAFRFDAASASWQAFDRPQAKLPAPPELSNWQTASARGEMSGQNSAAQNIGEPQNRIRLHADLPSMMGYGFYRCEVESAREKSVPLKFSKFADLLTVFVNGERVATSPIPPEERESDPSLEVEVQLRVGKNEIVALTDNLGHIKGAWQVKEDGKMRPHEQDAKGIFGPVILDGVHAKGEVLTSWSYWPHTAGSAASHRVEQRGRRRRASQVLPRLVQPVARGTGSARPRAVDRHLASEQGLHLAQRARNAAQSRGATGTSTATRATSCPSAGCAKKTRLSSSRKRRALWTRRAASSWCGIATPWRRLPRCSKYLEPGGLGPSSNQTPA
jgi:hypothetical protein